MGIYDRPPTFVGEIDKLGRRLKAVERRSRGPLFATALETAPGTALTTNLQIWEDTISVPSNAVLEFAANMAITHSTARTSTFRVYVDNTFVYQFISKTTTGATRHTTLPGSITGLEGTPGVVGSLPPAFIVLDWNMEPGDHLIRVSCSAASGSGTAYLNDYTFAARAN